MKILYIHQYFKLPTEAGGTRSFWISKGLINNKKKVVVITSKNNLGQPVQKVDYEGINIIYLNVDYSNNMGVFKRLLAFLKFMIQSTKYALREKDVDLVYATSTPLSIGFPALVKKTMHKTPYIFEVRDLWPEVPIQMGAIKNKLLVKLVRLFEKKIYDNSSHVIALSPGMKKGVESEIKQDISVSMIPNMSKIDYFFPRPCSDKVLKEFSIDDKFFYCIYFGTIGIANGLDYVIDMAIIASKTATDLRFLILGDGKEKNRLVKRCNDENLSNVMFLDPVNLEKVSEIVNLCHLSIVCFKNIEILKTNSPNKLFDSLSAGKPVLVNSSGWTKSMVENNFCGFYADPNNPLEGLNKILKLKNDKIMYKRYSLNSRELAVNTYDKSILVPRIIEIIDSINHV